MREHTCVMENVIIVVVTMVAVRYLLPYCGPSTSMDKRTVARRNSASTALVARVVACVV